MVRNWPQGVVMPAQTVLEELTRDELTRDHVQQRVDDWARRIEQLYDDIENWLPAGWTARRGRAVTMQEEPMVKLGVETRELPTLELLRDGTVIVRLRPYGLWIIGANGWIDLVKGRELYLISDHAKTFEVPSWHIAPVTARRDSKRFDRDRLQAFLAA
jgi:hypothetical protein